MTKLIVSDIDGTLVEEATFNIYEGYFDIIKKLTEKNVIVAVASGRQYVSMGKLFSPIEDKLYFLSDNGATITYKNNLLRSFYIEKDIVDSIIDFSRNFDNVGLILSRVEGYYIESKDDRLYKKIFDDLKGVGGVVEDLKEYSKNTTKLSLYCKNNLLESCNKFKEKYGKKLNIAISGSEWCDITNQDSTKGNATKFLQEKFNIKKEETIVFGNSYNDISMFNEAKYAYVTEDSLDDVKKAGNSIIESYDKLGAYKKMCEIYDKLK